LSIGFFKNISKMKSNFSIFTSHLVSEIVELSEHFTKMPKYAIICDMEGETLKEMAKLAGAKQRTIERRVQRAGIKPISREALYPIGTYEKIKDNNKVGHPKKDATAKSKAKPKKAKK
jgi:hypothetical protein